MSNNNISASNRGSINRSNSIVWVGAIIVLGAGIRVGVEAMIVVGWGVAVKQYK